MYSGGVEFFILGIVILWLLVLSVFIFRVNGFLNKLFPKTGRNFKDRLEEVLSEVGSLEEFKKDSMKNISKVALRRFNPYHDTGGDQSFVLALLDSFGDGVVISSLHSRTNTRVFGKKVVRGKEDRVSFSQEEAEVVKDALRVRSE